MQHGGVAYCVHEFLVANVGDHVVEVIKDVTATHNSTPAHPHTVAAE